jgi:hypothetical protein
MWRACRLVVDTGTFHDAVLGNGPMPLDLLSREVRAYITAKKSEAAVEARRISLAPPEEVRCQRALHPSVFLFARVSLDEHAVFVFTVGLVGQHRG